MALGTLTKRRMSPIVAPLMTLIHNTTLVQLRVDDFLPLLISLHYWPQMLSRYALLTDIDERTYSLCPVRPFCFLIHLPSILSRSPNLPL